MEQIALTMVKEHIKTVFIFIKVIIKATKFISEHLSSKIFLVTNMQILLMVMGKDLPPPLRWNEL